ncbi:MAG: hypothetical protein RSF69_00590 [Erysipelotrichaceae bacterium]
MLKDKIKEAIYENAPTEEKYLFREVDYDIGWGTWIYAIYDHDIKIQIQGTQAMMDKIIDAVKDVLFDNGDMAAVQVMPGKLVSEEKGYYEIRARLIY